MKRVSIIIIHYKSLGLTKKCLESVEKIDHKKFYFSIYLVDNNSPEPIEKDYVLPKNCKVIKLKENVGFCKGNNVAIKKALLDGVDYVCLLNNDTTVKKDFLSKALEVFDKDSSIGIVGPKIYFAPGFEYHKDRYKPSERGRVIWYGGGKIDWNNVFGTHKDVDKVDDGKNNKISETMFATGCAMIISRKVFEKVGFLSEDYYMYLEDLEFSRRAIGAGFKIIFEPKSVVWHYNAASSGVGGPLHDYFTTRNRLLFGLKYASPRAIFSLLRESMRLLVAGRYWQKRGVLDFYFRRLGKGSWKD